MSSVNIDMSEARKFFEAVEKAAKGDFKQELTEFMDALGNEFLRIVQDEIKRRKVMDTRLLLASFSKGSDSNIWSTSNGGLTLEVGTNVEYAAYVEYGHNTNPNGVERRWVPGRWDGDRFIYDPNAKTGMLLKQQWVEGKHYFQGALDILEKMFPNIIEKKLEQWMEKYFNIS